MRIKNCRAWWVSIPIAAERQHRSDFGQVRTFDAAILRIETEDGLVGWGEGKNAAGSTGTYGALVHMLNHEVGPMLVGRNAGDIGPIWEMLYNGQRAQSASTHGHAMPQIARRGMTVAAISAVDIALWDILGKHLGQPVWQLLGGRKADRLPAYASGGWASREAIGDQLRSYIATGGFRAVKMRVGAMDPAPHASAARVRAAREALGPDVDLMVDAHGTYTVAEAKRFAAMTADCDLAWFEEPVIADDKAGMAEIRATTTVPVATGESEATRWDFRDIALQRAADILQPDPAFCGGITEAMRIGALASAFNLRFAPHLWAGAPCFFSGLHICAASPASFIVEYSVGANPMIHDLVEETVEARDGMIAIPDRPGLGFTISERFLEEHAQDARSP
jgi:L-alanine-DL-glutamate epimerase-like enolase superfamily enzyme